MDGVGAPGSPGGALWKLEDVHLVSLLNACSLASVSSVPVEVVVVGGTVGSGAGGGAGARLGARLGAVAAEARADRSPTKRPSSSCCLRRSRRVRRRFRRRFRWVHPLSPIARWLEAQ